MCPEKINVESRQTEACYNSIFISKRAYMLGFAKDNICRKFLWPSETTKAVKYREDLNIGYL